MNRASNRRSGAQAEEWREIALPEAQRKSLPRLGFSCTAAEHWVYVIGGRRSKQGESPTEYLRDVLRYNCLDNTWEELDPLPAPARSDHSAVLVGSKIWVLGGQLEKSFCDSVACLDTDTLVWTVLEFRYWAGRWPESHPHHTLRVRAQAQNSSSAGVSTFSQGALTRLSSTQPRQRQSWYLPGMATIPSPKRPALTGSRTCFSSDLTSESAPDLAAADCDRASA